MDTIIILLTAVVGLAFVVYIQGRQIVALNRGMKASYRAMMEMQNNLVVTANRLATGMGGRIEEVPGGFGFAILGIPGAPATLEEAMAKDPRYMREQWRKRREDQDHGQQDAA